MVDLPTPKDIAPQHKMFRAAADSYTGQGQMMQFAVKSSHAA
jgi:hypothetical protein